MNPIRIILGLCLLNAGPWALAETLEPGSPKYELFWNRLNELHRKFGDISESQEMPDLPVLEQGRFVGETVRIIVSLVEFSITAPEVLKQPEVVAEVQRFFGSLYSLKPLFDVIADYNADPEQFAAFETGILAELFQLKAERLPRIREIVFKYKSQAAEFEEFSDEWVSLNKEATRQVISQLSADEKYAYGIAVNIIQEHGVLAPPLTDVPESE